MDGRKCVCVCVGGGGGGGGGLLHERAVNKYKRLFPCSGNFAPWTFVSGAAKADEASTLDFVRRESFLSKHITMCICVILH